MWIEHIDEEIHIFQPSAWSSNRESEYKAIITPFLMIFLYKNKMN